MFRSDRYDYIAPGLAAVCLVLALPYIASGIAGNGLLRCDYASQHAADGSDKSRPGYRLIAGKDASYKAPDCTSPKDKDQADLCQQRRMADAAAKATCLIEWQTFAAIWGLIGLALTVLYAWKAARHTREQAETAQETYLSTARPWLDFKANPIADLKETANRKVYFGISTKIENYGNSPAVDVAIKLSFVKTDHAIDGDAEIARVVRGIKASEGQWRPGTTVFPGAKHKVDRHYVLPIEQLSSPLGLGH